MTVRFARAEDDRTCLVTAWSRDRRPFRVSGMAGTRALPHDLVTFAAEQALGLDGGFFNLTAHGATFRSSGLRPTRPGRAIIAANRESLDAAEREVNAAWGAWQHGLPTPAASALEAADRLWRGLAPGEHADLLWYPRPVPTPIGTGRNTDTGRFGARSRPHQGRSKGR